MKRRREESLDTSEFMEKCFYLLSSFSLISPSHFPLTLFLLLLTPPHPSSPLLTPPHPSSPLLTPPHPSSPLLTPPHPSSPLLTPPHPSSPLLTPPHPSSPLLTPPHPSSPLLTPPHPSSPLLTPPHPSSPLLTPPHPSIFTLLHTSLCLRSDGLSGSGFVKLHTIAEIGCWKKLGKDIDKILMR